MKTGRGTGERLAEAIFARAARGRGKRLLAALLRTRPGGWLLAVAHHILPARQPIGVLAVVLDPQGRVLLLDHLTRADHPLGLPGGWLARAERPEDGLRRELREELGLEATAVRYLRSAQHRIGTGRPYGLTLVYRAEVPPDAVAALSGEVLGVTWLPVDEALTRLRGFEADAVRDATDTSDDATADHARP